MTHQPHLATNRLKLEPFRDEDLEDIFAYASDPKVSKYTAWPAHQAREHSRAFLDFIRKVTCLEPGKIFLVFAIKENNKVIGSIDYKNAGHPYSGQIDYAIKTEKWNQGLATEAAAAVRDWAFSQFPELVRLQAFCHADNRASARVMEKIGMEFEGRQRKALLMKNEVIDIVRYALIR